MTRATQELDIEVNYLLVTGLELREDCSMMNLCITKFGNLFFIPHHVMYRTGLFFLIFGVGVGSVSWNCGHEWRGAEIFQRSREN